MAGGMDVGSPARGGKKPLDAAINLVPFIDLMAVTISFLIMTAVWTQLGKLEVSQEGAGLLADATAAPPPPPVIVKVSREKITIALGDAPMVTLDAAQSRGPKLTETLSAVRTGLPSTPRVTVTPDDDVSYEALIEIIDACAGAGMPDVSVSAAM